MTREEALNILERINADVEEGLGYDHEKWVAEVEEAYKAFVQGITAEKPRWKKISPAGIYECSKCGGYVLTSDIVAYKYCHHCGARMEAE